MRGSSLGDRKIERRDGSIVRTLDDGFVLPAHIFESNLRNLARIAGVAIVYFAAGKLGLYFASFNASSSAVWPRPESRSRRCCSSGSRDLAGGFSRRVLRQPDYFRNRLHVAGHRDRQHARSRRRGVPDDALCERPQAIRTCPGLFQVRRDEHVRGGAQRHHRRYKSRARRIRARSEFARIWLTWWLGDVGGFLLVAPFLILWIEDPRLTGDRRRLSSRRLTLTAIALFGVLVFGGALPESANYPIGFICIPMLVWTAFRFGQREAATAMFVLAVSADWGNDARASVHGRDSPDPIASFIIPQAFMMTMAVMTLALAAVVWERKRAVADANEARNQAEAANRAKDQFLAMLGHELRNPIGALSSAVRVLERGDVRSQQSARLLEIMVRQSRHLARMVDDLLDVERLTAGRITLNRRPMNLGECARECVTALRVREEYADRNIDLRIEDAWIDGDPDRIAQILTNLLSNACKYTRPEGKIVLSIRSEGDRAVIRVEDDGDGIAADLLPHVFESLRSG